MPWYLTHFMKSPQSLSGSHMLLHKYETVVSQVREMVLTVRKKEATPATSSSVKLVLLDTPCHVEGRLMTGGRARLFPQWIRLTGWGVWGVYRRRIWLDEIEEVRLDNVGTKRARLILLLNRRRQVNIYLEGGALWKMKLEEMVPALSRQTMARSTSPLEPMVTDLPPALVPVP